jgi:transposase
MRDTELYRQILGLERPWFVSRVELKLDDQRADVFVEHDAGVSWACPQCDRALACRDHAEERTWRHLDTCQLKTYLRARVPRVDCPEHGVIQVRTPWAEARSRFTLMMERFVIDVLQQCATVQGARRILRMSWDEVWGVMSRAVARGQRRKQVRVIPHIGVDEKAFRKGHTYMTVVADLDHGTVEYVAENRKTESLAGFWRSLTPTQLEGVEAVAMDMWPPYVQATMAVVPGAADKIVFDRFHIMRHVVEAVNTVRKQEQRTLRKGGDETLTGTKYLWLHSKENLTADRRRTLRELMSLDLKVGRAWAIKEHLRRLWSYRSISWAKRFFRSWFGWATRSRLEPMRRVAHLLRSHLPNVLTYCLHQLTNAVTEGLNSKIMAIKRRACGYRNAEHFKAAIYFFCGGLDLYPR